MKTILMITVIAIIVIAILFTPFDILHQIKNRKPIKKKAPVKKDIFEVLHQAAEIMAQEESVDGKAPGGYGEFGFEPTNVACEFCV